MTDFHSHILPGVDDGSADVAESLALLTRLAQQGVDTVAATPHYHANHESVADFTARRAQAFARLREQLPPGLPTIKLGAEVRFYSGIGRLSDIKQLCLQDSNLLLLEMPRGKWTEFTLRELIELAGSRGVQLVLAHVERYWKEQPRRVWERLLANEILMQVNADFFISGVTRRKALTLLKNHSIHFLGSDCHNLTVRPPRIGEAMAVIRKKMGDDFADQMIAFSESWFAKNI